MVIVSLWLLGCSHGSGPTTKVAQQPALQTPTQASATQGLPAAEIPEKEFDFGAMAEDGTYAHEFRILNKGTGVLEVKEVMAA
jgi:hypothetical protein